MYLLVNVQYLDDNILKVPIADNYDFLTVRTTTIIANTIPIIIKSNVNQGVVPSFLSSQMPPNREPNTEQSKMLLICIAKE